MSFQPFETYLFEKATRLNSTRYEFMDRLQDNLSKKNNPQICYKNGVRFLELIYSLKYGFTSECVGDVEKTMKYIPTAFDSGLILPLILNTEISPDIISSLLELLKKDQRESGFWNYFLLDPSTEYDVLPEDIDDTSIVLLSLYMGKSLTKEECIQVAQKMRENFVYDKNGVISTFFKEPSKQKKKVLWQHFMKNPRIDIGSCLNCFWLFGSLGLDAIFKVQEFEPTMNVIKTALEEIERNEKKITNARYYTNANVLLFLLTRFVMASKFGASIFKEKLIEIVGKKLEEDNDETVIELACQIMVAINLNLNKEKRHETHIQLRLTKMLALQLPDGSWPRAPVYVWTPYNLIAATKAISTAFAVAAIKMVIDLE